MMRIGVMGAQRRPATPHRQTVAPFTLVPVVAEYPGLGYANLLVADGVYARGGSVAVPYRCMYYDFGSSIQIQSINVVNGLYANSIDGNAQASSQSIRGSNDAASWTDLLLYDTPDGDVYNSGVVLVNAPYRYIDWGVTAKPPGDSAYPAMDCLDVTEG